MIRYQGDFERAQSLCEQSLELYRGLDDKPGMLAALIQLARLLGDRAQWEAARLRVDEALALVESVDDPRAKADAFFIAGTNALLEADIGLAASRLTVSLRWMRMLGDRAGTASALSGLGFVAVEQRDFAAARTLLEESVALSRDVGDTRSGSARCSPSRGWRPRWESTRWPAAATKISGRCSVSWETTTSSGSSAGWRSCSAPRAWRRGPCAC